jgi:hypothetical protein
MAACMTQLQLQIVVTPRRVGMWRCAQRGNTCDWQCDDSE